MSALQVGWSENNLEADGRGIVKLRSIQREVHEYATPSFDQAIAQNNSAHWKSGYNVTYKSALVNDTLLHSQSS
jgi:hypothetical protein